MHDAIKYQGPSPNVGKDYFHQRHNINFPSGYRDLDGNQIVSPAYREMFLDKIIKTGGAILPLFYRNKSFFSLITQPFSQAYIQGYETYSTQEQHKILKTVLSGIGGFIYGTGLGIFYALSSIPRAIYNGWFAPEIQQHKADNAFAISSAPSNEPGLRVTAIMEVRDHLLQLMATANGHEPSSEQLITLLLTHVKKIHPALLSNPLTTEARYKKLLLDNFPLEASEWLHLFEPVIKVENNQALQKIINQYALQIDSVLIYALYECLTTPDCEQAPKKTINAVIDKHKIKEPQTKALAALVNYYVSDPKAKKQDMAQFSFNGRAIMKLKEKERKLRKIQTWMNNALDSQWGLDALLSRFMEQYTMLLNQNTLTVIVTLVPDSLKEVLHELLSKPEDEAQVLNNYQLDESQKTFLLQCAACYQEITSKEKQDIILKQLRMSDWSDSSLSVKAREHSKLTQFIQREWQHQLVPMDSVQAIINDVKKLTALSYHPAIDELAALYKTGLQEAQNLQAFDAFYVEAMKLQHNCALESPLREWVNVTMNGFVNRLLDEVPWTNDKSKAITNPLNDSLAVVHWLKHLLTQKNGVRTLLAQQTEQAHSFDHAAWRCQHILHALETLQPDQEYIRGTGMQKLLRIICQNTNTITSIGEHQAKKVPIAALCRYSVTMQHALSRVKEKIPEHDFVRAIDVQLKGLS
jgi:hypothetical protein